MKKTLKILLLVALLIGTLVLLTGCGKDNNAKTEAGNADKLIATKTTQSEDMEGNEITYEENVEVSFKNDKVDTVKMTYIFDNEETANQYVAAYNAIFEFAKAFQEEGEEELNLPEFKQDGNKATMELNAAEYEEFSESEDEEMTKEAIRKSLEEEGYTVK